MTHQSHTSFQLSWKEEFPWVEPCKLAGFAKCTLCKKTISVESMGRTALSSHAKGTKHKNREARAKDGQSCSMKDFVSIAPPSTSRSIPVSAQLSADSRPHSSRELVYFNPSQEAQQSRTISTTLDKFKLKDSVTEAEARWCATAVVNHTSLRNAENSVKIMKLMFPDSSIAQDLQLGKDKISYSIVYGLAPYYKKKLKTAVKDCKFFVVGFDESLNKVAQKQQMDINLRFWDETKGRVNSRYFSSVFLSHSKAEDLLDGLSEGLEDLDLLKILQFSLDGPNVNFKLIRLFKQKVRDGEDLPQLLDIGTCGLHVVNVAFQTGINKTGWEIISFLRCSYYLFKDSPTRRGIFASLTEYPLKFCNVRWLENVPVSQRCQTTLPHLKHYVESVRNTKDQPTCGSFTVVRKAVEDKLLPAKLAFFQSLAEDLEPFLREFQSDEPLAPFLHGSLLKILRTCMERFVKRQVLDDTPLQNIDVMKKVGDSFVNLKNANDVDLGYATRSALRKCKGVKDKELLVFRQECRTCLQYLVAKLLEKCPLKYPLTEALTFLNPSKIALAGEDIFVQLKAALDIVMNANLLSPSVIQSADREYRNLVSQEKFISKMKAFTRPERLDSFWMSILENSESPNLSQVVKLLLPLSHGNASLERGFSVNGDMLVENLKEASLIAQRTAHDPVIDEGGIFQMEVPKQLLLSMRNANARWKQALDDRKSQISAQEKALAEKRKADARTQTLQSKKLKIISESEKEVAAIDEELKKLKRQT